MPVQWRGPEIDGESPALDGAVPSSRAGVSGRRRRSAIGGSEPEAGGQQQAISTYRIELYGDPTKPLKQSDYLTLGPRKLNIQQIVDEQQNGIKLTLICGERHDP
jgi:hypothetical protein